MTTKTPYNTSAARLVIHRLITVREKRKPTIKELKETIVVLEWKLNEARDEK